MSSVTTPVRFAFLHVLGILSLMPISFGADLVPMHIGCGTRAADLADSSNSRALVVCPANCTLWKLSVFGSGIYASISSICGAALHSGVISASGGPLEIQKLAGRSHYLSSYAHGIQTQSLSSWSASFTVARKISLPMEVSSQTITADIPASGATKKAVKKPQKKPQVAENRDCLVDIAVLLDSSYHIGHRRFNLQKNFIGRLAAMLKVGPDGPHMGVVQASETPRIEFYLGNYSMPKDVIFALKEVAYGGGNTNTGKAILHTVRNFFNPDFGTRRGHPRIIVAFVDGWPSDNLDDASVMARESGMNLFIVNVAKAIPEEMGMVRDQDFMKKAGCKDNGFFTMTIPSWFSTSKFVKPLAQKLCSVDQLLCSKTCYNSVNLGFLIDGSSSVGDTNFKLVLSLLSSIARNFDISDVGSRIGAVQFTYDQRLEFGFSDYKKKDEALRALQNIPYLSGGTATGDAITYAMENLFQPGTMGSGKKFLIIVTDGQSYDDVKGPAIAAQRQGITVFTVGVAWAPMEDLKAMASEPKDTHVFFTREFSGLEQFELPIVRAICRDFTEFN
ncbi:cochlin isoform X2 [Ictalurus punctatus]|uniref:Cochlin n=1 Tax=Ictalurus punctatus TaxID=7998 RepID=A0A2D0RMC4_ICTPU|nr:cochlin isoform X2 [Ictalurus punctatus]